MYLCLDKGRLLDQEQELLRPKRDQLEKNATSAAHRN